MKQAFYPLQKQNIARAWQHKNTFTSFPFGARLRNLHM